MSAPYTQISDQQVKLKQFLVKYAAYALVAKLQGAVYLIFSAETESTIVTLPPEHHAFFAANGLATCLTNAYIYGQKPVNEQSTIK